MRLFGWGQAPAAPTATEPEAPEVVETEVTEYHTDLNPYCPVLSCWCHTNVEYHDKVMTGPLGLDFDDARYAAAMATLGGTV